jgi:hypothetical protein
VQVDPAGQLDHLGAGAELPVRLDRGRPGLLGLGQDRLAHVGVDLDAQREPHLALVQVPGQLAAAAGAIASHPHRRVTHSGGELRQREIDQLDQVAGGAGRGVARPQDPGQRLTRGLAAVQVGQQRREPKGGLVGARRAFLVIAVGQHQGCVGVDDQQLHLRAPPARPRAGARPARSRANPLGSLAARSSTRQPVGVEATGPNSPG